MELTKVEGMRYRKFLGRLHARHLFDWYLEVGCRTGASFAPVRSRTIAVDPYFRVETNVIGSKPALHVFQMTSDDFFREGFIEKLGIRFSFSFLDGMHLFEFLLRDFINTERNSRPDGVIALHDCCPFSVEMTSRDLDNLPKGAWTGDVWKLIPILKEYRPDLTVTVLDCAPTGLVLVSGLSPDNRVLEENYDEILHRYTEMGIDTFGVKTFYDQFSFTDAREFTAAGWPLFASLRQDEALALVPEKITP